MVETIKYAHGTHTHIPEQTTVNIKNNNKFTKSNQQCPAVLHIIYYFPTNSRCSNVMLFAELNRVLYYANLICFQRFRMFK